MISCVRRSAQGFLPAQECKSAQVRRSAQGLLPAQERATARATLPPMNHLWWENPRIIGIFWTINTFLILSPWACFDYISPNFPLLSHIMVFLCSTVLWLSNTSTFFQFRAVTKELWNFHQRCVVSRPSARFSLSSYIEFLHRYLRHNPLSGQLSFSLTSSSCYSSYVHHLATSQEHCWCHILENEWLFFGQTSQASTTRHGIPDFS